MIKYLSSETSKLFETSDKNSALINLLWGDRVRILDTSPQNGRLRVKARGIEGFVDQNDLGEKSLLEIYFIDVGQGDGILIRTPDDRHILIDGGYARKAKPREKTQPILLIGNFIMTMK
jgi:beta-lactamase superfamily II metal-dependent hydrolase